MKSFQRAHRSRIITEKRAAETGSPFLQNDFTYTDLFVIRIFDAEETQSVARRININRSCSADLYLEFAGRRCVRRRAADLGEGFAVDGNAYQAGRIFGRTGIRCHNRQLTRGGSRKVARPVAVGLAAAAPLDESFGFSVDGGCSVFGLGAGQNREPVPYQIGNRFSKRAIGAHLVADCGEARVVSVPYEFFLRRAGIRIDIGIFKLLVANTAARVDVDYIVGFEFLSVEDDDFLDAFADKFAGQNLLSFVDICGYGELGFIGRASARVRSGYFQRARSVFRYHERYTARVYFAATAGTQEPAVLSAVFNFQRAAQRFDMQAVEIGVCGLVVGRSDGRLGICECFVVEVPFERNQTACDNLFNLELGFARFGRRVLGRSGGRLGYYLSLVDISEPRRRS